MRKGIQKIEFNSNEEIYLLIFIHQSGLMFTDLPDAYSLVIFDSIKTSANIEHQFTELLNYKGEKCDQDSKYKLDMCRFDYISQVNLR